MRYHYFSASEKIILALIVFTIISELVSMVYGNPRIYRNMSWINLYVIVEALTICFFYFHIFSSGINKGVTLALAGVFLIVSLQEIILTNKTGMNHIPVTFESVIFTLFSVLTFHQLLQKGVYSNILDAPVFWINSAFLFYFTGTFFLHLFSSYLTFNSPAGFVQLWGLWHSLVNISLLILISIGFWKTRTSQT